MGTATASLQIEGGDRNNSWFRWAQNGHIKDGSSPLTACDHWNRVEEDVLLMKRLNARIYRLSLEWSRIEPEEGRFDHEAIAHYRHELELLRENGIEALVTLHHFSNPLWLEDDGGWTDKRVINRFERYARFAAEQLGDLVSEWVTINEPNVYLLFGYVFGLWPPGEKKLGLFLSGARNMIGAHLRAYRTIHRIRDERGFRGTKVGAAHHLRIFEPAHGTLPERIVAWLYDRITQDIFVTGMTEGRLVPPLGGGYPEGKGSFSDFSGINYYSRDMVSFSWKPSMLFGKLAVKEGAPVNDLGWEIYPEGLFRLCARFYRKYRKPVYITENGTADSRDLFRARYISDHLYEISRLVDEGIDVRRYYHWTLMDNFEWIEGESARFGLYKTDYATQERKLRRSGEFFAETALKHEVSPEMIAKYLESNNGKKK